MLKATKEVKKQMEVNIRNDHVEVEGYVNAVERNSKPLSSRLGKFVERIERNAGEQQRPGFESALCQLQRLFAQPRHRNRPVLIEREAHIDHCD